MSCFIGRQEEIKRMRDLQSKRAASFILVKGRRRIGKSRLIKEFSQYFDYFYSFSGLPPSKKTSARHQLEEFSRQMAREFKTAPAYYNDWSDVFWALGERIQTGKILLLPDEIISENPFFQRRTSRQAGCQIDYMIQTKFGTLYVCEIKFSKLEIGLAIVDEVQKKINAISLPSGFSCRPVLVHVNGVSDEVIDSDYFAHIINFGSFLSQ